MRLVHFVSLKQMAKKERKFEMCVFKQACAMAYDKCYICDGFDYNCTSYQIQIETDRLVELDNE